jgi:hypothetical protein
MPDVFGVTGRIGLRCPRGEPRLRRSWTLRSYASNFTKQRSRSNQKTGPGRGPGPLILRAWGLSTVVHRWSCLQPTRPRCSGCRMTGGRTTRLQGCPQCCGRTARGPCRPYLGNRGVSCTYDDDNLCLRVRAWLRVRTHLPMLLSQVSWSFSLDFRGRNNPRGLFLFQPSSRLGEKEEVYCSSACRQLACRAREAKRGRR